MPPKAAHTAQKPTDKRARAWAKLVADQEQVNKIIAGAKLSKFFDPGAPGTVRYRKRIEGDFEAFVKEVHNLHERQDIWNSSTFLDFSKQYMAGYAAISKGLFGAKVKASTLWRAKFALYFWAVRHIDDFATIFPAWHSELSAHIAQTALEYDLSTMKHEKNNLGEIEISLIFKEIMKLKTGLLNAKQHYTAILLAWTTSARPGSFTIARGYEKGAPTGVEGVTRSTDETLYWKDVQFVRMEDGIAARVTLHYTKGYRNPHAADQLVDPSRTFTFVPTRGTRFEFDLSLILFGLAYNRGLFTQTLDQILEGDEMFIPTRPEVAAQPVFVAANQAGSIVPNKGMTPEALNDKLKELCRRIGLLKRNTYYSLRRTAIIETRRTHGEAAARNLAFHVPDSGSLFAYDNVGFGDEDMTAFRLGEENGMTRKEIGEYFSQARIARIVPDASGSLKDLPAMLTETAKAKLPGDPEYIAMEKELKNLYDRIFQELKSRQESGQIPDDVAIPWGYSGQKAALYQKLMSAYGLGELEDELASLLARRKTLHKSLRNRFRNEALKEFQEENKKNLKALKTGAKRPVFGKGRQPEGFRNLDTSAADAAISALEREQAPIMQRQNLDDYVDEESDAGVDADVLEEEQEFTRQEPECWEDLGDDVTIRVDRVDEEGEVAQPEARLQFLKEWIAKGDSEIPTSGLRCPRCQADPTTSDAEKTRVYALARLNIHLKTDFHSREQQLRRAWRIDQAASNSQRTPCPCCGIFFNGRTAFFKHLHEAHPEEFWEGGEEESDGNESDAAGDDGGNSDDGDGSDGDGNDNVSSGRRTRNKGKGKARQE
ncbi:uncharacterized protein EI97DRAFT_487294 [Westerdykella ornata]|uniref:C2H2-type domain-containing protein n=1 Tax=Westerdykella ornata TaxID=318751 RepID=A0A6A6J6C4_WESOR|nr:uncharacterized protein EI97DRAFT_487294 [Westerdykella ornata]KAF2271518.1 hypothetical protein EI97DRAFT_487294 [Westerdykella ornata]